jgi:outer membrane protein OmpA-like peptidoglycan-associated protein
MRLAGTALHCAILPGLDMGTRGRGIHTVMKRFLLLALSIAALCAAADPFLLQSENVGRTDPGLELSTEGGYEAGLVPDWFLSHRLGLGLFGFMGIDLEAAWGGFPDQDQVRLDSAGAALRFKLCANDALDLQAYVKGVMFFGEPIFVEYTGALTDVAYVLSPRAEGGYDAVAGLAGILRFGSGTVGLYGDLSAAYTGGRTAFAPLAEPSACFRLYADLCPVVRLTPALSLLAQNRLTWWSSRGFMYDVLPQACLEPVPGLLLAVGGIVPVLGGGAWSLLAGVRWTPTAGAPAPIESDSVKTVREGKGMRLRVYLSFLGDKADLFQPRNAKFGAKNRQILEQVAAYLKQFEGYDIVIEGHTNRVRFDISFEREQKEEMLPLAEARAKAVLAALAELGIDRKTMKAVAVGGSRPLAKFEDPVNNWKNRRVEIVITKR